MHCCAIYSCFSVKRNHTEDEEVSKTHKKPMYRIWNKWHHSAKLVVYGDITTPVGYSGLTGTKRFVFSHCVLV